MEPHIDPRGADPGALHSPWQTAQTHSRYLRQLLAARPQIANWLGEHAAQPVTAAQMSDFLAQAAPASDESLKRALRQLRQRVMATLIVRDLGDLAPLSEVVESMTQLADVTTNFALDFFHRQLSELFGEPLDSRGQPQRLLVIGMGKLGGRELNVSSDVDYIFVYPEEGQTGGKGRRLDNYDFFLRLGKRLISALGDLSEDGQVFRVDMRLRPNGDSGPLVGSLGLAGKLLHHARPRMGTLRLDQGPGDERRRQPAAGMGHGPPEHRPPFVFRKYLDFGAINAMRDLHAQIRREVARKDMADHIKLGPGGIREIEFIAQVFQLIRGGREPAADPADTAGSRPARRTSSATDGERARAGSRLRVPAPPRAPSAIRGRCPDAHAAGL
jgi:glutamate-ammonia-ligase adenylyltransferase